MKGQSDRVDYTFTGGVVSIGRGASRRTRSAACAATTSPLPTRATASRKPSRARTRASSSIRRSRGYVLFNESGTNPTFVLRGGRSLRVTPRDRRGVRVGVRRRVQLGRAIVEITIADGA